MHTLYLLNICMFTLSFELYYVILETVAFSLTPLAQLWSSVVLSMNFIFGTILVTL